ncbi:ANTAR domain-containing protein [Streptomyces sp. DT199]|uniref:ANTAR domain-containing protein n=1 Tax=Streptomyces TaxID=1883 RepID=UPI0037201846
MTASRVPRPAPDGTRDDAANVRLEQENARLRQAVASHARIDQALGILIATHRMPPAAGFEVLREVSQRTNTKLHTVAETVVGWALGQPLPESVGQELEAAVQRHSREPDSPEVRTG